MRYSLLLLRECSGIVLVEMGEIVELLSGFQILFSLEHFDVFPFVHEGEGLEDVVVSFMRMEYGHDLIPD